MSPSASTRRIIVCADGRARADDPDPYIPFFPEGLFLLVSVAFRPPRRFARFRSAGFRCTFVGDIVQEVAANWPHYATRITTGADSVLASLNQEQFHAGLCRLRDYAAKHASTPVTETIDYLPSGRARRRHR